MIEAEKEIVIFSPKLFQDKVDRFIRVIKPRQEAGVKIAENDESHYAVIDEVLVWHGGINLLGKEDASELLLMAYK